MKTRLYILAALGLAACVPLCQAQQATGTASSTNSPAPVQLKKAEEIAFKHASFSFVRVKYGSGTQRGRWATDYPDADVNFSARFQKETGLKTDLQGKVLALTDPELKRHPFIYIAEPGSLSLSEAEVPALREYLLGGGFLMADDFWGEAEWQNLEAEMKRVFPDRQPTELPIEHAIFHCFYDIYQKPQVPNFALGEHSQYTGVTWEREDAKEARYRGLFDDQGRLMAVFCHNTDLADGWEREGVYPYYFKEFSQKKAYPMGINIVVYALTQ